MAIIKRHATEDYVVEQQTIIGEQLESLKNNAVLFTPQILTEDQKAQARENLGILKQDVNNTPTPPLSGGDEESITTEYVYTYDGNLDSEEHAWITNYGNIKVFSKMA